MKPTKISRQWNLNFKLGLVKLNKNDDICSLARFNWKFPSLSHFNEFLVKFGKLVSQQRAYIFFGTIRLCYQENILLALSTCKWEAHNSDILAIHLHSVIRNYVHACRLLLGADVMRNIPLTRLFRLAENNFTQSTQRTAPSVAKQHRLRLITVIIARNSFVFWRSCSGQSWGWTLTAND